MTKRTGNAGATQAGSGTGGALAEVLTPLIAGMTATRTHLLEWVHALGIDALPAVFRAEAEALAGPKGQHQVDRTPSSLGAHGDGVDVRRPARPGGAAAGAQPRGAGSRLPAVAVANARFAACTCSSRFCWACRRAAMPPVLRRGRRGAESRDEQERGEPDAGAGVGRPRRWAELEQRLDGVEAAAPPPDGAAPGGQMVIAAPGLTRGGASGPAGCPWAHEERRRRGTDAQYCWRGGRPITERALCVMDAGKGVARRRRTRSDAAANRGVRSTRRNLQALLPKPRQADVRATLERAYRAVSPNAARRQLKFSANWLESNGHVDAGASLREGLEETLTVLTLKLADAAAPSSGQRRCPVAASVEPDVTAHHRDAAALIGRSARGTAIRAAE